jgi:hypothetical protein
MECKICEREKAMPLHFKEGGRNRKICDDCLLALEGSTQDIDDLINRRIDRGFSKKLDVAVQKALPNIMADIIKNSDLTFELVVC